MPEFSSQGVSIAYQVAGEGKPMLLVHGFAATAEDNWIRTGWVQAITRARRQAITFDLRGHGASSKLYDPADYTVEKMAGDALALLDHLGLERASLMGYSMGAGIAAHLAAHHGDRFGIVILGGVGEKSLTGSSGIGDVAAALDADSAEGITEPLARGFRLYAEGLGQDLKALAACARAPRGSDRGADLGLIRNEVLVIAGARDDLAGDPGPFAARMKDARAEIIPGTDHMFALANPMFKGAVMDFLAGIS
ncbi:MAG: alpha/beta hydrolase [Parvibaculum sp.]|uniref:alpha/beta fold hydrolase n=1 Tax=Parvibaculum sp. TaxID=2024848 RepID=UPI0027227982|nr:alpha/beta hydrolase [Parvibaculum sp.]MDO8839621.1 alpha/beta hydrolase [Parvibaculum sp.]